MDVNSAWNQFHNTFLSVLSNHIPNKILTTRKSLPWITYHLQLQVRKWDKAYNKAKRTNSTTDWAVYRRLRNKGVSLLRSAKRTFLKNLSTNLRSPKQSPGTNLALDLKAQTEKPSLQLQMTGTSTLTLTSVSVVLHLTYQKLLTPSPTKPYCPSSPESASVVAYSTGSITISLTESKRLS